MTLTGSRTDFDFGAKAAETLRPADAAKRNACGDGAAKKSSLRRGFERMEGSDALALNDDALGSLARTSALMEEDQHALRVKTLIIAALLLVVFLLSLGVSTYLYRVHSPAEVLAAYALALHELFNSVFTTEVPLTVVDIQTMQPYYYDILTRLRISVLTMVGGVLLALAGTLYQNVFRNPIAAPTMLGVSSGVNVGILVLVLLTGTSAIYYTGLRHVLCYAAAFAVLAVVLLAGRAIGGKDGYNLVNMLLVGSIISQLVGTVTQFVSYYCMDETLYEIYFEVQEQLYTDSSWVSFVSLFTVVLVAVVPVFFLRFNLNALSFADDESRLMGVNANALRFVALLLGSVMVIAAMIYCGNVAMLSLIIPHVSRVVFGSDFRKQFVGNVLLGALVLLVCRDIADLVFFFNMDIPLGTMVSFITMPVFVWMVALQQRSWE